MAVLGSSKGDDKQHVETETAKKAEIGIAVERELRRYRQTIADIDRDTAARQLAAQKMFASRVEAIVQRISPLVSGQPPVAEQEHGSPE